MYIRPKTKRRLVILGSAFSIVVGVLVIGYVVRARRLGAQVGQARAQAMAAHAAGEHAGALESFAFYLDESKTADRGAQEADAEAILAYAESRAAVEADKGRHLYEAVKILERYLRLRPTDAEARRMLLELQPRIGYNDEALQLADAALADNPNDTDALWARVRSLRNKAAQDRQFYAQALAAAEQLTKAAPTDLRAQVEALRLMAAARRPEADVVARAESVRAAHPGDPRFDLLLATAYLLTRQPEPAATWLRAAAESEAMPDAAYAQELVRHFSAMSMFPDALRVLERGAAAFPGDADLARALAWRLWEQGRHDEVVSRFADVDPARGDATIAAIRAMSLIATKHAPQAAAVTEALAKRPGDTAAAGWAVTLKARLADAAGEAQTATLAAQYRAAVERDAQNPAAQFLLGEAYARMGELELAGDAWAAAARLAPAWAAPLAMSARAAIDAGRYADAVRLAEAAYRRAPRDVAVAADWVVASYGVLQGQPKGGDAAARAALLTNVEAVQKDAPGEPRTLPVYVALLADAGRRDDAVKVARAAIAGADANAADIANRLAIVSRTHGLGLEAELLKRSAEGGPQSPRAALRTAALLLQSGDAAAGLTAFDAARVKAAIAGPAGLPWDVARLEYRDLSDDAATAADWAVLADANPKDLAVQSAVLRSPARARDRALWQRAVVRVKDLTGPGGHLWQVEQARLALAGNVGGDELSGAIALLEGVTKAAPSSAEPRRLLALAYERRGRERTGDDRRAAIARAAEEIQRAADLRPTDPTVLRDLVAILRMAGLNEQAVQHLDRLASNGATSLDLATREWVAEAYAQLGASDRAAALLDGAPGPVAAARLASIRRRQGDPEEAADLYRKLLAAPDADAAALIEAAEFFVDRHDPETAQQFITKLTSLPLRPGAIELIRGRFQERRGKFDEALAAYRAATAAPGAAARAWHELAGFLLRQRRTGDAAAAANEGLRAAQGNDTWLTALLARAGELGDLPRAVADDPTMPPLVAALSLDPSNAAAVEMLNLFAREPRSDAAAAAFDAVRAAADRHPEFLPLQYRAVRMTLAANQPARAEQTARRAARLRPDDAESARLVAATLVAQREWSKAKTAALAWRALAWDHPLPADLLVAQAMIETGEAVGAVERLRDYVSPTAPPATRDDPNVVSLYARALIATGRTEEAAALLAPRTTDPAWRRVWLSLAPAHRDAPAAAKWIERIAAAVPPAERTALAEAWFTTAQRFGSDDAYRAAFATLSPGAADLDTGGQSLLALCAQAVGDYPAAVAAHRAVLAAAPTLPEAKNNLAYALTLRGGPEDLSEARQLADEAVRARPDNATFRDTLARVDLRAGRPDAAAAGFRAALQAEPDHLEARLGLADVLSQTQQRDEALNVLLELEKDLRAGTSLPPYLSEQLRGVRAGLKK